MGTALSNALKAVSEHPAMYDDPFMYGGRPGLLNWVYEAWRRGNGEPLSVEMMKRICFKEVPANFDPCFNEAIARAAEPNGYRHIHLVRCNVFAQLASRGVAEQLDAWSRDETATKTASLVQLEPLDVDDLIRKYYRGGECWAALERDLPGFLTVRSEDVASRDCARRRVEIVRILDFLDIPADRLATVDDILSEDGDNTEALWSKVPNIEALSRALAQRGIG